jgi:tetratricopeptide (TPR) repeat protein
MRHSKLHSRVSRPKLRLHWCFGALLSALLGSGLFSPLALAAEPEFVDPIDMSVAVGQALKAAIDLKEAGKFDEAAAAIARLRTQPLTDYETTQVLLQAVNLDITTNNYVAAITDSEALLLTQALSASARASTAFTLSKLYLQQENWNKALPLLQQINTGQGSNNQETLYLLGFGYYRSKQPELATQYLLQAQAVAGAQVQEPLYSLLGMLYTEAKLYDKALTTYEKLLSALPDAVQAESYNSTLAQLYVHAGDNSQAKATLQLLISKYPNSAKLSDYQKRLAALP